MNDATYVGAGMPCGQCGNPLIPGQPHKCGWTPTSDAPKATPEERLENLGKWSEPPSVLVRDALGAIADARLDERELLSARVYENGWCPTCASPAASPADERLREAQDSDSTWPWPIAPDTVMPPRRQPVRWGSRADDPPTEIHDDPQRTKAYLAGLATGRAESRDRTEALRQIVDLPVVDDSDADRMREIADAALAGVSAEATPERGGVGAIDDGPVGQERSGESVVAPPPNPYRPPEAWRRSWMNQSHNDEEVQQMQAAAYDRGFAAGLAARDANEPKEKPMWKCEGCGTTDESQRYDNGVACDACVLRAFAENG